MTQEEQIQTIINTKGIRDHPLLSSFRSHKELAYQLVDNLLAEDKTLLPETLGNHHQAFFPMIIAMPEAELKERVNRAYEFRQKIKELVEGTVISKEPSTTKTPPYYYVSPVSMQTKTVTEQIEDAKMSLRKGKEISFIRELQVEER